MGDAHTAPPCLCGASIPRSCPHSGVTRIAEPRPVGGPGHRGNPPAAPSSQMRPWLASRAPPFCAWVVVAAALDTDVATVVEDRDPPRLRTVDRRWAITETYASIGLTSMPCCTWAWYAQYQSEEGCLIQDAGGSATAARAIDRAGPGLRRFEPEFTSMYQFRSPRAGDG